MSDAAISFDHVHIISEDPHAAARWYEEILGGTIRGDYVLRDAPQINVIVGGVSVLIRGRRPGEDPGEPQAMRHFEDYSSHDEWGTDHFGFRYQGDLAAFCDEIRAKGATFSVEPWEFGPGALICYLEAPDGVSIELVQARPGGRVGSFAVRNSGVASS